MKKKVIYECQYCGKEFSDPVECLSHELNELGIGLGDLLEWKRLKENLGRAKEAAAKGKKNSPELKKEYNRALGALNSFVGEHGLKGKIFPKY